MRVQTAGRQLQRYLIDYDQYHYVEARPRPDCPVGCGAMIRAAVPSGNARGGDLVAT